MGAISGNGMSPFQNEDDLFNSFATSEQTKAENAQVVEEKTEGKAAAQSEKQVIKEQISLATEMKFNLQANKLEAKLHPGKAFDAFDVKMSMEANKTIGIASTRFLALEVTANNAYSGLNFKSKKEEKQFRKENSKLEEKSNKVRSDMEHVASQRTKFEGNVAEKFKEFAKNKHLFMDGELRPVKYETVEDRTFLEENHENLVHIDVEDGKRVFKFHKEEARQAALGKEFAHEDGTVIVLNHENVRVLNETEKHKVHEERQAFQNEIKDLKGKIDELKVQYDAGIKQLEQIRQQQQQLIEQAQRNSTKPFETRMIREIKPQAHEAGARVTQAQKRTEKEKENIHGNVLHRTLNSQAKAQIIQAKNRGRVQKGVEKKTEAFVKARQEVNESKLEHREEIQREREREDRASAA